MATNESDQPHPLAEIVAYLFSRREAILNNWRTVCEQDPSLSKVSTLSREEFNNLLPIVLDILEQRLLNKLLIADPVLTATSHGLHRWHKGHNLIETLQELHHLTRVLNQEVHTFQQLAPQTDANMLLLVQNQISELMSETINGSAMKYDELQRLEAANRAASLQQAIQQMEELTRQRSELLRTSSHDLRGSFSIINSTAYLLKMEDLTEPDRQQFLDMLNRNLSSIRALLDNLIDLSRLEAGKETLQIQSVDAAQLLRQMVDSAQPLATQRGLKLQADGPASLPVQTDPVKLQRIVQNLLLNALTYTPTGFISVSWSQEGDMRWNFSIQDSGQGLPDALSSLLATQLKSTVEPSSTLSPDQSEPTAVLPRNDHKLPPGPVLGQQPSRGEGVCLQIVKRLCELMGAALDIETQAGRGTLFRIRLPIQHEE